MVAVPAEEGRPGAALSPTRICDSGAPGFMKEAIHLRQVGRGCSIRLGEEGDRRGVGLILQPTVNGPLIRGPGFLQPGAPLTNAVFVLRPESASVVRTFPASAVRRRRRGASGASQSCEPPGSKSANSGPRTRSLPRRRRRAVHACCTARGRAPAPYTCRSSQHRTTRRGHWAAWMRATRQVSRPPVSRRCLGQRRTSRSI